MWTNERFFLSDQIEQLFIFVSSEERELNCVTFFSSFASICFFLEMRPKFRLTLLLDRCRSLKMYCLFLLLLCLLLILKVCMRKEIILAKCVTYYVQSFWVVIICFYLEWDCALFSLCKIDCNQVSSIIDTFNR